MKILSPLFIIVVFLSCFTYIINTKEGKNKKKGSPKVHNETMIPLVNKTMSEKVGTPYIKNENGNLPNTMNKTIETGTHTKKDQLKAKSHKKKRKSPSKHKLTKPVDNEENPDIHGEIIKKGSGGDEPPQDEKPNVAVAPAENQNDQAENEQNSQEQTSSSTQQNPSNPPTSSTQQSQPTSSTQQSQPTSSTQQSQPPSSTQQSQPPSSTQQSQPPSSTQQSQPTSSTQQSQPTSSTQQSQPLSSAQQGQINQQSPSNLQAPSIQQGRAGQQPQQGQANQPMNNNCSPSSGGCQAMTQQYGGGGGGGMGSCSQLTSQCNPPYNSMPQNNCGFNCIPNINDHFSNCNSMLSSCASGQGQYQMNPMTSPNMCNNLLGLCQNAAMSNTYQTYAPQCANLLGQCAPSAFGSMCSPGMTPMIQPSSSILSGCSASPQYDFMGDDLWTPPTSSGQLSSMFNDCNDYLSGSYSGSISPVGLNDCQNLMSYCRDNAQNNGYSQLATQCAGLLSNCFPTGDSSSCMPGLSTNQCQSYLSNCIPGANMDSTNVGNAASANIDQCIGLMSQCYPSIQGPPIQTADDSSSYDDCSALLRYCNCLNSNCNQPVTPIPGVSANDCATLIGSCYSAASHVPGIGGMPAGCAPNYTYCKKSCIPGCPKKCCSRTRSGISKNNHH